MNTVNTCTVITQSEYVDVVRTQEHKHKLVEGTGIAVVESYNRAGELIVSATYEKAPSGEGPCSTVYRKTNKANVLVYVSRPWSGIYRAAGAIYVGAFAEAKDKLFKGVKTKPEQLAHRAACLAGAMIERGKADDMARFLNWLEGTSPKAGQAREK